jgi:hypothetical protein
LKEEADAELNKSKEDRVVIAGLPPPPLTCSNHLDKKKHYTEVVSRLINLACASSAVTPRILDVHVNLRKDRGQPLVEVRFDTAAGANQFRREGAQLTKAEHAEFQTLFFSNAVTQATRVRIEVLKALAKKLTTDTEVAYVQGFISRPVLQYRAVEGSSSNAEGIGRSYNYVDAIAKFGSKVDASDLSTAYVRAGNTFVGAMSQYFIILSDDLISSSGRVSVNRAPLGRRGPRPFGFRRNPRARGSRLADVVTGVDRISLLSPRLDAPSPPERGTKRPGEPSSGPSKRNETLLQVTSE